MQHWVDSAATVAMEAPVVGGIGKTIKSVTMKSVVTKVTPNLSSSKITANPFKNKTPSQIDEMFTIKGFEKRGPDPMNGLAGYVNSRNGRSYHIDFNNSFGEAPHIDINRLRSCNVSLQKRKFIFMNDWK